ncbi:MAG TPA: helix-turn-helix domain-containing protein [Steroidobacteraceae bacterium]|nr:helix-turn-helix domain-containing protein [Steroidobacteraceae bacterium]
MQQTAISSFEPTRFLTWSVARGERPADESASSTIGLQLDQLSVLMCEGSGTQGGHRRPDHIRDDHADYFVLTLPVSAALTVRQDGRDAQILPGRCALVSTSRPSQATIRSLDGGSLFRSLHIRIPGPLLRRQLPQVDDLCGREIPAEHGIGAVLRDLVESAIAQGPYLTERQAQALGHALFCTICSVGSTASETIIGQSEPRDSSAIRLYARASAYIEARLSDPTLSIADVAAHCRVSVRYLHLAFASCATTVAAYIRERRLQGCRAALLAPTLQQRSIIEVAGDWGFEDPSYFSHTYKARFGVTPRQDRKIKLGNPDGLPAPLDAVELEHLQ